MKKIGRDEDSRPINEIIKNQTIKQKNFKR